MIRLRKHDHTQRIALVLHTGRMSGPARNFASRLSGDLVVIAPEDGPGLRLYEELADLEVMDYYTLRAPRSLSEALAMVCMLVRDIGRFAWIFHRERVGCVIAATTYSPAVSIAALMLRLPHIVYCGELLDRRQSRTRQLLGRVLQLMEPRVSDVIICCSKLVARQFSNDARASVVVMYPPVARGRASVGTGSRSEAYGVAANSRIVAVAGTITPGRAQDTLIEAMATVVSAVPETVLLIAGEPEGSPESDQYLARLQRMVGELSLQRSVRFCGHVADTYALFEAADVVVNPARFPEPFGRTIYEALAVGTPVVATTTGALTELLTDRREALFVPPDSPRDMAEAIISLLDDPRLGTQLVASTEQILAELDIDRDRERFASLLHGVLDDHQRSSRRTHLRSERQLGGSDVTGGEDDLGMPAGLQPIVAGAAVNRAGFATAPRVHGLVRPRAVDVILCSVVAYLALAPTFTQITALGSIGRFGLAAVVAGGLVLGVVPARAMPLSLGGWVVLLFAAYQTTAVIAVGPSAYSLLRMTNWIMFIPLAFVRYDTRAVRLMTLTLGFMVLVLFVGVLLQKHGTLGGVWGGQSNGDPFDPTYAQRFTSFLLNPNDLGLYMIIGSLTFFIFAATQNVTFVTRCLSGLIILVASYTVFQASSRGAFLAVPVALAVLFAMGARRLVALALVIAVIGLGLTVLALPSARSQFTATITSIDQIFTGRDASANARQSTWSESLANSRNVVTGAGYGGYASAAQTLASRTDQLAQYYVATTVDNTWLQQWLEEGLLGVAMLAAVFCVVFINAWRARLASEFQVVGLAVAAIAAAMLFRSFSVDLFDVNPWNGYLWLVGLGRCPRDQGTSPYRACKRAKPTCLSNNTDGLCERIKQ